MSGLTVTSLCILEQVALQNLQSVKRACQIVCTFFKLLLNLTEICRVGILQLHQFLLDLSLCINNAKERGDLLGEKSFAGGGEKKIKLL